MQIYNIIKDKDGRELTQHGDTAFPLAAYDEKFSKFTHGEVPWHWHEEIELVIVYEGSTNVEYVGGNITLNPGDGIFINANMLHKMTWVSEEECSIINFVLKPELIGGRSDSRIFREYIAPICTNSALPVVILSPNTDWQNAVLIEMNSAFEAFTKQNVGYEMVVISKLMAMWHIIYSNGSHLIKTSTSTSIDERRIREILKYIQHKFMDKISVSDIAAAAGISDSECFRLFNRVLKYTPGDYLLEFRLRKSSEKLINSSSSILEIALDSGFNSSAYFTKRFKEYYNQTPMGFRKNKLIMVEPIILTD